MRQAGRIYQQTRPKKNLLIAGADFIVEALKNGEALERIFLQNNIDSTDIELLKELAKQKGVPVNKVPFEKIRSFNLEDHCGCIALKSKIKYQDLQDIISFTIENGEVPLVLILDGITDIRNIGAIARSAYCCGVHALVIPEKGVGALNEDAITTSAGALEKLAVCRLTNLHEAINILHLNGIKVFGSEMKSVKNIFEVDFSGPSAIVMGSEDKGIQQSVYKECDEIFCIPMKEDFESLNVSVAAGIILYECMRQKVL